MIGEQNSQDGTKNVSAKVPKWVADLLNIICEARGTNIYGLMQLVLEFIIETAKVSGPVPPQMQAILQMLKMDADWNKAFRFSNPTAQMDVAQVILILQQHDGKQPRKGFGLCMIDKPFLPGETPTMTLCVDDILERVTEVSMPGLYRDLRQVGVAIESCSVRETLTMMCHAQLLAHLDEVDMAEMPGMGNHHDFGRAVDSIQKYKRVRHRTPDSLANSKQQTIRFDEYDKEQAELEATRDAGDGLEQDMGFRPHGQEW